MKTPPEAIPRRRRRSPSPENETPEQPLFITAKHQAKFPKAPDMQRGFQTIVTDIFADGYDVTKEWGIIRKAMIIDDALTPDRLKRAANEQEDIAIRAHRLYVVAKIEVKAYMRDTESTFGAIREAAVKSLEAQKANGSRTKQITDADVLGESARLHPDEWANICTRRERAEAMLSQLSRLSDVAKSRCYTVSNMMTAGMRTIS